MHMLHFHGGPTKYGLHPHFYKKIFVASNLWFFKNLNYPINKDVGGVHKTPQILGNRIISENFRSLHF